MVVVFLISNQRRPKWSDQACPQVPWGGVSGPRHGLILFLSLPIRKDKSGLGRSAHQLAWEGVSELSLGLCFFTHQGIFTKRAAGGGLSKGGCCVQCLLCSNVVLVHSLGPFLKGLLVVGCPRAGAVYSACCVVMLCWFTH